MGRVVRDDSQTVGSWIIPLTLASLFALASLLDQSTYALGLEAVVIVLVISLGIALMVVTPWIAVGVCALMVVASVIVDVTFLCRRPRFLETSSANHRAQRSHGTEIPNQIRNCLYTLCPL